MIVEVGQNKEVDIMDETLKRDKETIGCSDSFFKCTNYCYECRLKDDPFNCFDFRHLGENNEFK